MHTYVLLTYLQKYRKQGKYTNCHYFNVKVQMNVIFKYFLECTHTAALFSRLVCVQGNNYVRITLALCFVAQVLMAKESEVFQHCEGPQGDHAKGLGNPGDRFPQRGATGGLRRRVPVFCQK